eukprot:Clim_evm77s146 gene=Clim_evmTU77s146
MAAKAAAPANPPQVDPAKVPVTPRGITAGRAAPKRTPLPYPGPMEGLHQECKQIFTTAYLIDGCKFAINKPVGSNLQVSHTINLGPTDKSSSYHFGATYVGTHKISPTEQFPVVLGDLNHQGNLIAQVIHQFNSQIRVKAQTQNQGSQWGYQLEGDYKFSDAHFNVKAINANPLDESGILLANYLQSVTPNLALGAEMLYQYGSSMEDSGLTFAARYKTKDYIATVNASPQGMFVATYVHQINEKVALGSEIEANVRAKDSIATVGAQFNFRQSTFRGSVDTTGVVSAVLEQHLMPGITFAITGAMDHNRGQNRFGFGLTLGQ